MKTILSHALLPCVLLALLAFGPRALAQSKTTPPPFPGWANKATPGVGAATTATAAAGDNKDFLGVWEGALMNGDGSNPGQRQMNMNLTITPDKITSTGQGTPGDGTYRISGTTGKFRHIDATGTSGQYNGKHYEGIFTIEGNTLKWCSGNPGSPRPKELKTNMGAGCFLMVLTRKQ